MKTWFKHASLSTRLSCLYGASVFLLVLLVAFSAYVTLFHQIHRHARLMIQNEFTKVSQLLKAKTLDLKVLADEVTDTPLPNNETTLFYYVRVLDVDHQTVLMETPNMSQLLAQGVFPRASDKAPPLNQPLSYWFGASGMKYVLDTREITGHENTHYHIQIALNVEHERVLIARFKDKLFLLVLLSLLLSVVMGHLIARRATRHLNHLVETAEGISVSTLTARIDTHTLPKELIPLAQALNTMLERLQTGVDHLTELSANLAHELRTPLTILTGETEVTLQKERSLKDYRAVLTSNLEEYQRLSNIIHKILFLAKVQNGRQPLRPERFSVQSCLETLQQTLMPKFSEKNLSFHIEGELTLFADKALCEQAFLNLLINACQYTPPKGHIAISFENTPTHHIIHITDTGMGIAKEDLPHLGSRFYRSKTVTHIEGSGLGLAMTASIMSLHLGQFQIQNHPPQGARASLSFPNSSLKTKN